MDKDYRQIRLGQSHVATLFIFRNLRLMGTQHKKHALCADAD